MKKGLTAIAFSICALSGCTYGIEKEYTMTIEEAPIEAKVEEGKDPILLAHCTRGMSLYNYYIVLPEMEEDFKMPKTLKAKATKTKTTYTILKDDEEEKVSDHGYVFISWEV